MAKYTRKPAVKKPAVKKSLLTREELLEALKNTDRDYLPPGTVAVVNSLIDDLSKKCKYTVEVVREKTSRIEIEVEAFSEDEARDQAEEMSSSTKYKNCWDDEEDVNTYIVDEQ